MTLKRRGVAAATTAALMLGFGSNAFADSTFDLVQALVNKGILTEEEALPLLKGRENDIKAADDKVAKKAKLGISDAIDNAKLYGDIRARYEMRQGENDANVSQDRDRARYKLTFGVTTEAKDFYTDLAFAMGSGGRSDNATFGGTNGANNKETLFVKRAMVGWHATDWLDIEAGRVKNPLYTTSMVWDADLTFEGLTEQATYNMGNVDFFGTFVQSQYLGDYRNFSNSTSSDRLTNFVLAFQGGAKFKITDDVSAKAAITFTKYTNNKSNSPFIPTLPTATVTVPTTGTPLAVGNYVIDSRNTGTNDLKTIEVPAEVNFKLNDELSLKAFGDYAFNLDGDDRYDAAVAAAPAGAIRNGVRAAGNDDKAWLLGLGLESKQGKKTQKGDWNAKVWYQDVGIYALDQNAVDSDFMDSRVNMKGVVLKGEYAFRDNVLLNLSAGHATRKNDDLAAVSTASDISLNLDNYDLYQFDVTYKF